jgi:phosphohistidine phosphatase
MALKTRRRLLLLRHAKSDWPAGVGDHDRPLGPRGRHDAPRMGEEMARRGLVPDLAIVSTAARARETWMLVAPFLKGAEPRFEKAIYGAGPEALVGLVRELDDAFRAVMLVGHNPGLEMAATLLIGGGPARLRDRLGEKFPTAALAVIDFDDRFWSGVRQGNGRLVLFLTPGDIE